MTRKELISQIKKKQSFLCVGLDTDIEKIPNYLLELEDPIFEFNKQIIDVTKDLCVAYKPNIAFYESMGVSGWNSLQKTLDYIPQNIFTIADAKRGDIGNTSSQYAAAILDGMGCDAITISPYMGADAIKPFIENPTKGVFILAVTSNPRAAEIQNHKNNSGHLYEKVIQMAVELNINKNIGLVVGATKTNHMTKVRELSPGLPWLIPGIGTQGGDLETALEISHQDGMGIINISRGILYAGDGSIEDVIKSAKNYTEKIRSMVWNPVNC